MNSPSTTLDSALNATATFQHDATTVEIYDAINPLVQAHWEQVLSCIGNPTLFQHHAWHQAFLHGRYNSAQHGQPLFVCISENGQPKALIPLLSRRTRQHGLPIRQVELMFPTDMGVRDLPVADGADSSKLLLIALQHALPAAGYRWDIASLPDLVLHSTAWRAFQQFPGSYKLSTYHHDSNRLRCSDEATQPFANVSKSHVKKTRRKRKNLESTGNVEFELFTDPAALPDALNLFIDLENSGWKGSSGERTSLHHDQPQKRFYESLTSNPAPLLNGCVAIMRLEGKPVAINVCNRVGDTLWMLKITYEDSLQEYSPGNLMLLYLLEKFAGDSIVKYISFITGGEWTWRWSPERQPVLTGVIFNKTPAGLTIGAIEYARQQLRQLKHRLNNRHKSEPASDTEQDETS